MMRKEVLGYQLSELRKGRPVESLSKYAVKSIEKGRSSYPVSNLIVYCNELNIQLSIIDSTTDDVFPVNSTADVHAILQLLMKRWKITELDIYKKTEVHYTPPKGNEGSLSINTLLTMLKVLHCKLKYIQKTDTTN